MKHLPYTFRHLAAAYPPLLWVRLFGETLTTLSSTMIAPFLVLYLSENIGSSVTLTMLVIGLQPCSEIILTIFAGGMTDRFRRKSVMLLSLLLQSLAMLGMALTDSMLLFALSYVVNGAGRSLFIPASRAMLADVMKPKKLSSAFALLNTASSIGAAIGPLIGVLIYQQEPSLAFLLAALSLLLYAVAVWRKIPHTDQPASSADRPQRSRDSFHLQAYRPAFAIMLLSLPISLFYSQTETNLQLHLKETLPQYLQTLALLATVKGTLLLFFEFLLIRWTQHLSPRLLIAGSSFCFAGVALGYAFLDHVPSLLALQVIFVLGESIGLTHLLTFVSRIAPPSMRGRYYAITGTHWDISRMCGPFLGSLVLLHAGGAMLFTIVAVILLLGGVAMHLYLGKIETAFPLEQEG